MTPQAFKYWALYINRLAKLMKLKDWKILLSEEPTPEDIAADICVITGRRVAVIRLCEHWEYRSNAENRQSIVHELLHAHHHMLTPMVKDDLVDHLSPTAHQLFVRNFDRQLELMVDILSEGWAMSLPYPSPPQSSSEEDEVKDAESPSTEIVSPEAVPVA